MFIGGGSGSTAGGIKTSTLAVLFFTVKSALRGRNDVLIGRRKMPYGTVIRAVGLTLSLLFITILSGVLISELNSLPLIPSLFETFSAMGTVGLSTGITPGLSELSLWILCFLMFLGRVGILTIFYALAIKTQKNEGIVDYPEVKFGIG